MENEFQIEFECCEQVQTGGFKENATMGELSYSNLGCKEISMIGKAHILPGREYGSDTDEFLVFYGRCPNCGYVRKINTELIPTELQKELMYEYAGIADIEFSIWSLEYQKKQIAIQIQSLLERKSNVSKEIKGNSLSKKLFPHWGNISDMQH